MLSKHVPRVRETVERLNGSFRATLPYPPTANKYWRNVNGRMVKSREAREYQAGIQSELIGIKPLTGDLKVWLTFCRPQKRGDLDNLIKIVLDSLEGAVYENDCQIAEIEAKRIDGRPLPEVYIQINRLS